ncbi:hypothetical protein [Cupriavidus pauculus]|uniref:hypothetical protein n=1 Tax=Cupriavidus pauculus TaxID=82633 RepID=UPI001FD47701|nr:hypothetical protein [Cupriavidus pauculus]
METRKAGWQLDFFGEAAAIIIAHPKPDPQSDASDQTEAVKERLVDALIDLACGSRHGTNMPESLLDCCKLLRARIENQWVDKHDYYMTLGWIFGYWDGAIPYSYVCDVSGVSTDVLQDVVLSNRRLKADLEEVRHLSYGTLL